MREQMRMYLDGARKRCQTIATAAVELIQFFNDIEEELNQEQKPKQRRFRLMMDLPTFEMGETFTLEEDGCLYWNGKPSEGNGHWKKHVMAYHRKTLENFPGILEHWFEEIKEAPEPIEPRYCNMDERDHKTKQLFRKWLDKHPNERFFQAVRNFAGEWLNSNFKISFVYASEREPIVTNNKTASDTFYWECDNMLRFNKEESE